jgi:hypothetical protein
MMQHTEPPAQPSYAAVAAMEVPHGDPGARDSLMFEEAPVASGKHSRDASPPANGGGAPSLKKGFLDRQPGMAHGRAMGGS